jgi:mycothiol system anti-sigma-R factor
MTGDCGCGERCTKCEELVQPYLDRELTEAERLEAETHLLDCGYCAKRYRFESTLRMYVRECCEEPMPAQLKQRLASLRTPVL